MIEAGLVLLIDGGITGISPAPPGGFGVQLPKDQISSAAPAAWCYRCIVAEPSYTLTGQDGLTDLEIEIQCHGLAMANAITLGRAIDNVLNGEFSGTLSDPDSTVVRSIFRMPGFVDGYSDANRSFVRTLEYKIQYYQT